MAARARCRSPELRAATRLALLWAERGERYQAYEILAAKFPLGLADIPELPEELSGAVNALGAAAVGR